MARATSVIIGLILVTASLGQDSQRRIGFIDFYGYAGLDLDRIRAAIPIREGDIYPGPNEPNVGIQQAVSSIIGHPPTDISPVCCDSQGKYVIFIGLPGESIRQTKRNPVPKGKARLPREILKLYEDWTEALTAAILKGNAGEDTSRGYAVSTNDPSLRARQLAARAYAIRHEGLIRRVLESSSETQQRIVAAFMLGYASQSSHQIASLVRASRDADETVRNNATRALAVLAESSPTVASRIPADGFIEMLSSGSWTDRNKAGWVLSTLTRSRDSKLLDKLRSQALVPLIEMARWRNPGYAHTPRILLGRIAGIEEKRLVQLVIDDKVDEIIKTLRVKP